MHTGRHCFRLDAGHNAVIKQIVIDRFRIILGCGIGHLVRLETYRNNNNLIIAALIQGTATHIYTDNALNLGTDIGSFEVTICHCTHCAVFRVFPFARVEVVKHELKAGHIQLFALTVSINRILTAKLIQ